jgi:hypothetical protein
MIKVEDRFQNYIKDKFDKNTLVMLNEIIFYGIFIYYYYLGPIQNTEQNFKIIKYIIAIFILRYLCNYVTSYTIISKSKNKEDDKKEVGYFQINGKVAVFTILILFLSHNHEHLYGTLAIVFSYALLSSAATYGYTIDNLITVGITYFIISLNLI